MLPRLPAPSPPPWNWSGSQGHLYSDISALNWAWLDECEEWQFLCSCSADFIPGQPAKALSLTSRISSRIMHPVLSAESQKTLGCALRRMYLFFLTEALWDTTVSHVKNALFVLKYHCVTLSTLNYRYMFPLIQWVFSVKKRTTLVYCQGTEPRLVDDWLNSVFVVDVLMDDENWEGPEELFSFSVLHTRNSRLRLMNTKLSVKWVKNWNWNLSLLIPSFFLNQLNFQ